ncbi:uncharacterized protein [Montipora foliosa]
MESGHSCSSRVLKLFKLIDAFGNQHLFEVPVCDCESHAVTLVRCQFWPGSPERLSVGFHFKLMDLAEKLFLHSQVSVKEFSELILEMTPPLQPNFIPSLYAILNSGCFEEYRKMASSMKVLMPASVWQGRKQKDCNRFHAGEVLPALRSKGKDRLFDEKGVFGRVCRHDFPKSLLSIKHGESGQEELLSDVSLAIPIFQYCYGHKASCQVQFSPRRTPNVGLTDGEGVERFWSYLRQFSTITKEMSVDKRVDVLTDASLHYGEHLFYRCVPTMKAKLQKASTLMSALVEEISKQMAVI